MVRPRAQTASAVRMRVGHACDGGTSLPGWLEDACAFGRSARLRVGSVRFSGHGGPGCRAGGRAAALAGQAARRGWRHGSAPYASIADDSEVDCDRPIKCCDDIHSIFHYRPAPAIRGRHALRGVPTIREILTVAMFARCVSARQRKGTCAGLDASRYAGRGESSRYVRGSGSRREGRMETVTSGWNEPTCRRQSRCDSANPVRAHWDAAREIVEKRRKQQEENCRPVDRAFGSG